MAKIKWYKRHAEDHFNGTRHIPVFDRLVYTEIIDLIYMHDGKLVNDDQYVAGCIRVGVRKYNAAKDRLLALGKIYVEDGFIRNRRCDLEAEKILSSLQACSEFGTRSGQSRRGNVFKIKDLS